MCDVTKIWAALLADERFTANVPEGEARDVVRKMLVEQTPTLLAGHLDRPVDSASLAEVKMIVVTHIVANDVVAKMVNAFPSTVLSDDQKRVEIDSEREFSAERLASLEKVMEQIAALPSGGTLSGRNEVSGALFQLERLGIVPSTLTIRQLIERFPSLIYAAVT